MRTTINIDEHVLATARRRARELGITLGHYVERAVVNDTAGNEGRRNDPEIPVSDARLLPGIENMSNSDLLEFLDRDVPLAKRR